MSVDVLILLIIVIVFVIIFLIILIVVLPLIKNKSNQTTQITQPLIDKFTSIEANLNKFNNDANEKFVKMNTTIANLEKSTVAKCEKIDLGVNELNATFSNSQKRGIGGEFILEAILTQAFGENNSIVQFQPTNEDGTRPDALINFANYKIPIDSKFPLVHYQQIKAHTNTNIELLKKNFKKDLDNEAKKVKGYINVEKNNINFAIIFLPFDNMLIDMME
jgi:DNA anti-recombination protein RmuC